MGEETEPTECNIPESITYMKKLIEDDPKHCEKNDGNKETYYNLSRDPPRRICLYEDIHKYEEVKNECQEAAELEQEPKSEPEPKPKAEQEQEPEPKPKAEQEQEPKSD